MTGEGLEALHDEMKKQGEELRKALADTVGYNYVKSFATPGWRNTSRDYSRQYEDLGGDPDDYR